MRTWGGTVRHFHWHKFAHSPNARTVLALLAILLGGLALRIVFWYGLVNVDPFAYADAAASIARRKPVFDPDIVGNLYYTQYLRLSLIVPAAAMFAAFGPGEVQATVFPIACSLAMGLVAFGMVFQAGAGRVAGLIAAFITVVFPLSAINSTQFLPDTVMAFWASLAILLFWRGLTVPERPWRERAVLFAAVGFTWALAFYGRQTAVGLALPLAGLVLYYRRLDWAMAAGAAGAFVVWAAMTTILLMNGGDFLEDVRTVVGEGRGSQPGALGYTDLDFSYFKTFTKDRMFVPLTGLTGLGALGILLTWRTPGLRRREMGALAIIVIGLFLYFEFLMRLPSLYSWWKEPRYVLTLVAPMAAVAGIGMAQAVFAFRWRPLAFAGAAGLLLLMTTYSVQEIRRDHDYWRANRIDAVARSLASELERRDEPVVYIWNDDLARYLSFHVGLDRTTFYERAMDEGYLQDRFTDTGGSRVSTGSLVITTSGQPEWFRATAVPAHWRPVWSDGAGTDLWSVPAAPGAIPLDTVAVALSGEVEVTAAGISPDELLPQHHAVVGLAVANAGPATELRIGMRCGAEEHVSRTLPLPPGDHTLFTDLPAPDGNGSSTALQCAVAAGVPSGALFPVADVTIGFAVPIEPELLFSHDPELERQLGSGWFRADQPFFSGGGAAVALDPYQRLHLDAGNLGAGDYWVVVAAYDYGTGQANRVRISLNGVEAEVEWGGTDEAGVVSRPVHLLDVPAGGDLTVEVEVRGQDGVTIDSVVVSTLAP